MNHAILIHIITFAINEYWLGNYVPLMNMSALDMSPTLQNPKLRSIIKINTRNIKVSNLRALTKELGHKGYS